MMLSRPCAGAGRAPALSPTVSVRGQLFDHIHATMVSTRAAREARPSTRLGGWLCGLKNGSGAMVKSESCWIFLPELFSDSSYLPAFELGDLDRTPSLGSADERAEHQFQDRPLAEGIGDDFEAPALLGEEALEQIRGSNPTPIASLGSADGRCTLRSHP
jgi:hypothetical protein